MLVGMNSLSRGLSIFQEGKSAGKDTLKLEAKVEPYKFFVFIQPSKKMNLEESYWLLIPFTLHRMPKRMRP